MLLKATSGHVAAARPARASRGVVAVHAAARPTWYPGAEPPKHLDGSLAADFGFDPLYLGVNKDALKWFAEGELYNGRVAMFAVVGILGTEALGLPNWWEAGALKYSIDNQTLAAFEIATFAVLESFRYNNYKTKGITGLGPWAPFDPLGLKSKEYEVKEIKNGRLAMLAFIGFASQAAIYGKGPIACLQLHLADPSHNNIYTSVVGKESAVTVALLSFWPIIIEASKSLDKKQATPLFPWAEPWKN